MRIFASFTAVNQHAAGAFQSDNQDMESTIRHRATILKNIGDALNLDAAENSPVIPKAEISDRWRIFIPAVQGADRSTGPDIHIREAARTLEQFVILQELPSMTLAMYSSIVMRPPSSLALP